MGDALDPLLAPQHLEAARRILAQARPCDHCLGRSFARVGTGLTNDARGRALREALKAEAVPPERCSVCEGLFAELEKFAALVEQACEGLEFRTFLVGSRVAPEVKVHEEALWSLADGSLAEEATSELNREVGKRVAARAGKEVDLRRPEVTAILDTRFDVVELQVAPLFLYGRYRKLVRGIPQTRWPCRRCKGRGCLHCDLTGKQYETSVQELVQAEALRAFGARDADFHGMGREDVDARCLGAGRPFVLELKEPRRRSVDLASLEAAINAHARGAVEVEGLRASARDEVAQVKEARGVKEYRALVRFEEPVEEPKLYQAVQALAAAAVAQRTPSRVAHRRAMRTRHRAVLAASVERASALEAVLRIRGEAGLYVKELVSGDAGRTRPSLAELLGVASRVAELDVVAVEAPPPKARKLQEG